MRAGVLVSIIGHIGFAMMTMLAWEARSEMPAFGGSVVPVEIVDVAEESNVRALTQDVATEEPAAAEEQQIATNEAPPAPTPTPTPQRRNRSEDAFEDLLRQGMTNTDATPAPRRVDGASSDRTQAGAGLGTAERASLEDRASALMRDATNRCWRSTADMPDPERLVVVLEVQLNRNGGLVGQPTRIQPPNRPTYDPLMQEALRRAEQAVRLCDPYTRIADDRVVGEHYDIWRSVQIRFGPREN